MIILICMSLIVSAVQLECSHFQNRNIATLPANRSSSLLSSLPASPITAELDASPPSSARTHRPHRSVSSQNLSLASHSPNNQSPLLAPLSRRANRSLSSPELVDQAQVITIPDQDLNNQINCKEWIRNTCNKERLIIASIGGTIITVTIIAFLLLKH